MKSKKPLTPKSKAEIAKVKAPAAKAVAKSPEKEVKPARIVTGAAVKPKLVPKTVKDLRPAKYNPRTISKAQIANLDRSLEEFGQLGGVVFNCAMGNLVAGHQRIATLEGKKTKLVKSPFKDDKGTVAEGYIEVYSKNEKPYRIPYREVSWSSLHVEQMANIAANAQGGSFDTVKLGKLVEKLQRIDGFDLALTGLDKLDAAKTVSKMKNLTGKETPQQFEEVSERTIQPKHQCPKCGYKFS